MSNSYRNIRKWLSSLFKTKVQKKSPDDHEKYMTFIFSLLITIVFLMALIQLKAIMVSWIFFSLAMLFSLSFFMPFLHILNTQRHQVSNNKWVKWTLIISMNIFVIGLLFLTFLYPHHNFTRPLFYDGTELQFGILTCTDNNDPGPPLANFLTRCISSTELAISNLTLNYQFNDGLTANGAINAIVKNGFIFTPPVNLYKMHIYIEGKSEDKSIKVSAGGQTKFLDPSEVTAAQQKFVTQLIGLLSAVIFSIPVAAYSLKELAQTKTTVRKVYKRSSQ